MNAQALFEQAVNRAKAYRDQVISARRDYASTVVVVPMVIGPDNLTKVPCGEVTCPRCVADQFEKGRLSVTSIDDGYELRSYEPDEWAECTVYGSDGHILYSWSNR